MLNFHLLSKITFIFDNSRNKRFRFTGVYLYPLLILKKRRRGLDDVVNNRNGKSSINTFQNVIEKTKVNFVIKSQ